LRGGWGSKIFARGLHSISKNTGRRNLIFAPIDSETRVSYLSIIHFDTLTPLFFELSLKKKKFIIGQKSRKIAHFFIFEDNSKIWC